MQVVSDEQERAESVSQEHFMYLVSRSHPFKYSWRGLKLTSLLVGHSTLARARMIDLGIQREQSEEETNPSQYGRREEGVRKSRLGKSAR